MGQASRLFVPLLDNGNGSVMSSFMRDFFDAFRGRDIVFALASDSHANRGMNKIANAFLATDCDAWFNVDADIRFRKQDADMLIEHIENGVPLVYGIYPKKEDATQPCLCTFATVDAPDPKTGLTKVRRCGRGFMLVKREVLEAMKEDNGGRALRYHNHGEDGELLIQWDFFPSGVVTGEFSALESAPVMSSEVETSLARDPSASVGMTKDRDGFLVREWISEDWYFCERARVLGYPTLVDERIALGHVGLKEYRFSDEQVTRLDSHITSWNQIHGWYDYETFYHEIADDLIAKAEANGKSVFVEVGCWLGRSIAEMHDYLQKTQYGSDAGLADWRPPNVQLHVVDTFTGESENAHQSRILEAHGGSIQKAFRGNMEALGIELTIHAKPSVEASAEFADGSIDAVFIDGDHHYGAVLADIIAWLPKVKPGGILSGHDVDETGVLKAVKEIFGEDWNTRGRCWIVRVRGASRTGNGLANERNERKAEAAIS